MRAIWKGTIAFGLLTIPVKLYAATEQRDVSFKQVRASDGAPIRYKRVTEDGDEVPYSEVAKGYPLADGEMLVLTSDDMASLPLPAAKTIEVLQFTPAEQVDPIMAVKSYYLEPDGPGAKPYVLLRDALEQSGKVAVVKVALRQRESLAVLRVREGVFVLETMLWPDEVRSADFPFLEQDVEVKPQEREMAADLIGAMTADFDPGEYRDGYREALEQVIQAKISGAGAVKPKQEPVRAPAADLVAALEASVKAAKGKKKKEGAR